MKIWTDINEFAGFKPVATIGIFDGVHQGHLALIEYVKSMAAKSGGESVIITLWPHPRRVLGKVDKLNYLTSLEEKKDRLRACGVDHLVLIPFTKKLAQLRACKFVEEYLVKGLRINRLVVGFDHKFGKDREGDYDNLSVCAEKFGFEIEQFRPVLIAGSRLSSSVIREYLVDSDIKRANHYLGYSYFIHGKVVSGNRIGRKIGFPTANIEPDDKDKLIPGKGVYAVLLEHSENLYKGMLNIGYRPTIDSDELRLSVEIHIFNFDRDIYGERIKLIFKEFIREEKKFTSLEELRKQLERDRERANQIFENE